MSCGEFPTRLSIRARPWRRHGQPSAATMSMAALLWQPRHSRKRGVGNCLPSSPTQRCSSPLRECVSARVPRQRPIWSRPSKGIAALAIRTARPMHGAISPRSEEHTSELQSHVNLVCRLLLEKKKKKKKTAKNKKKKTKKKKKKNEKIKN